MFSNFNSGLISKQNPTMKFFEKGTTPGIHHLDPNLTINGITVTPTARYKAVDATLTTWPAWDYGETLTLTAVANGSNPTFNTGSPFFGPYDDSIQFGANIVGASCYANRYLAQTTTFAAVTTEDFVMEFVGELYGFTSTLTAFIQPTYIFGKYDLSNGWLMGGGVDGGGSNFGGAIRQSSPAILKTSVSTLITRYSWAHVMIFVDRSGSMIPYINGIVGNPTVIDTVTNMTVGTQQFFIGSSSRSLGDIAYPGRLSYVAMWKQDNWLNTHLQAEVARKRYLQLTGLYPRSPKGDMFNPIVYQIFVSPRFSTKVMNDGTTKIFLMAGQSPRVAEKKDANGTRVRGFLSEGSVQNVIRWNRDFGQSTWSRINSADSVVSGVLTLYNRDNHIGLIADSSNTQHGFTTGNLGASNHDAFENTIEVFAHSGDKRYLLIENLTIPNCYGYFDLQSGLAGTKGSAVIDGMIEDYGDGWYQCGINFLNPTPSGEIRFSAAASDGVATFAGDGIAQNILLWGANWTTINALHMPIPTASVAVTSGQEQMTYSGIVQSGLMDVDKGYISYSQLTPNTTWQYLPPSYAFEARARFHFMTSTVVNNLVANGFGVSTYKEDNLWIGDNISEGVGIGVSDNIYRRFGIEWTRNSPHKVTIDDTTYYSASNHAIPSGQMFLGIQNGYAPGGDARFWSTGFGIADNFKLYLRQNR